MTVRSSSFPDLRAVARSLRKSSSRRSLRDVSPSTTVRAPLQSPRTQGPSQDVYAGANSSSLKPGSPTGRSRSKENSPERNETVVKPAGPEKQASKSDLPLPDLSKIQDWKKRVKQTKKDGTTKLRSGTGYVIYAKNGVIRSIVDKEGKNRYSEISSRYPDALPPRVPQEARGRQKLLGAPIDGARSRSQASSVHSAFSAGFLEDAALTPQDEEEQVKAALAASKQMAIEKTAPKTLETPSLPEVEDPPEASLRRTETGSLTEEAKAIVKRGKSPAPVSPAVTITTADAEVRSSDRALSRKRSSSPFTAELDKPEFAIQYGLAMSEGKETEFKTNWYAKNPRRRNFDAS